MRDKILEHFITLTKIPHCSRDSKRLFEFLVDFAKNRGYEVLSDSANNILVKSKNPKIALQAHYDMVCIGEAPNIEVIRDKNWLKAKNSSLGADNGVAIAMMMVLMDMRKEGEFLFTSDEEIGLIGASNIELEIESKEILNLDFEDEAKVCIGCAGGADINIEKKLERAYPLENIYKIEISGLKGGHSGIDIDKNIPNAIKHFAKFLKDIDVNIAELKGGERINSIPTEVKAVVSTNIKLEGNELIKVEPTTTDNIFYKAKDTISMINSFKNGAIEFNRDLNIVDRSINLALINLENGKLNITLSARAMNESGLNSVCDSSIELFDKYNFKSRIEDKYPSWEPKINQLSKRVYKKMKDSFKEAEYVAIHAGLECGVLAQKYPNKEFCSIGPEIISPHSKLERVDIDSIEKTFNLILELL